MSFSEILEQLECCLQVLWKGYFAVLVGRERRGDCAGPGQSDMIRMVSGGWEIFGNQNCLYVQLGAFRFLAVSWSVMNECECREAEYCT